MNRRSFLRAGACVSGLLTHVLHAAASGVEVVLTLDGAGVSTSAIEARKTRILSVFLVSLLTTAVLAQGSVEQKARAKTGVDAMTPSEAFGFASQPFNEARSQPNDLTESDRWALGVSIQRAVEACQALTPYKKMDEQLLAVGKLCVLGQQFEPAAEALVPYLSVPNAKVEEGSLLLSRAYIGMEQMTSAESQMETLMAKFPYDAGIHYGIDQVIESTEGINRDDDQVIQRLNAQQLPFLLKALHGLGVVMNADKSGFVTTAVLFQDALRCAVQLKADGHPKEAEALAADLKTILDSSQYATSSELPSMQAAFQRYQLTNTTASLNALHARLIARNGPPVPRFLNLQGKPVVMIAVALSAPASVDAVNKMTELLRMESGKPGTPVLYVVTSYGANGGDEKDPVAGITQGLQGLAQALPLSKPLYLLDDAALQSFAIDRTPMAIAIDREGHIRFLGPLVTQGDDRLLRDAVIPRKVDASAR